MDENCDSDVKEQETGNTTSFSHIVKGLYKENSGTINNTILNASTLFNIHTPPNLLAIKSLKSAQNEIRTQKEKIKLLTGLTGTIRALRRSVKSKSCVIETGSSEIHLVSAFRIPEASIDTKFTMNGLLLTVINGRGVQIFDRPSISGDMHDRIPLFFIHEPDVLFAIAEDTHRIIVLKQHRYKDKELLTKKNEEHELELDSQEHVVSYEVNMIVDGKFEGTSISITTTRGDRCRRIILDDKQGRLYILFGRHVVSFNYPMVSKNLRIRAKYIDYVQYGTAVILIEFATELYIVTERNYILYSTKRNFESTLHKQPFESWLNLDDVEYKYACKPIGIKDIFDYTVDREHRIVYLTMASKRKIVALTFPQLKRESLDDHRFQKQRHTTNENNVPFLLYNERLYSNGVGATQSYKPGQIAWEKNLRLLLILEADNRTNGVILSIRAAKKVIKSNTASLLKSEPYIEEELPGDFFTCINSNL